MSIRPSSGAKSKPALGSFLLLVFVLLLVLGWLFAPSFKPGWTLFLNDGPLGSLKTDYNQTPSGFLGVWQDLNWVGANGSRLIPNFTFLQLWLLGPEGFSKFHAPAALLVLGFFTWFALRKLGFSSAIAALVAIAAALNMNVFSNACWGLSNRAVGLGIAFLGVAAIGNAVQQRSWVHFILAGLTVGMGISEGADVGVMFSVVLGIYAFFTTCRGLTPKASTVALGVARVTVMVVVAAAASWTMFDALFLRAKVYEATQAQRASMAPEQHWDWATQWSLPKAETFRLIVPGLHGYRMDTPDGGRYWGTAGRDPQWETTKRGFARYSGAGEYAGVTVMLFAAFACAQALRRQGNLYSISERQLIAFWAAVALIALLFAWGRYAPFYRIVYAMPYFSNIRNPVKWTHILHLALLMLFAYGLQALWRGYLDKAVAKVDPSNWWAKASAFDKKWVYGCFAFLGLSVLGWMVYSTSTGDLVNYLLNNAVVNQGEAETSVAKEVARFSQREVTLYLVFLVLSMGAMMLGLAGFFRDRLASWLAVILGGLLVIDLARANVPWIQHYDYQAKYSSNALFDYLKGQHTHQRASLAAFATMKLQTGQQVQEFQFLQQQYYVEWLQQQFPFYNIPSIDVIQDPRPSPENVLFREKLQAPSIRLWELTSTRYLLGLANPFADYLNQQYDGNQGRFKQVMAFTFFKADSQRFGMLTNETGPFALLEFSGALPRASLFTKWQTYTNDEVLLNRLADPGFVPSEEVLISGNAAGSTETNAPAGTVEMTSYAPKRIQLKTQSAAPAVVMLTDKFDVDWNVRVDGLPATLLRCNFLMRGVQVPAGSHVVEFEFQPPMRGLYISLAAIGIGFVLCGVLLVTARKSS